MNHLDNFNQSEYGFFALRHGQSKANVAQSPNSNTPGIIISNPEVGTKKYGLSEEGKRQVAASITAAKEQRILTPDTFIYSSDFLRTVETAQIAKEILNARMTIFTELLRERNFGMFEGLDSGNYELVWDIDKTYADENASEVETINSVLERTTRLIARIIKARHPNTKKRANILLVSHGDALQILETGFRKMDPRLHRSLEPLKTAELRQLKLASKVA
ncbi:histidine phosphatase family protein [Candidatus Peregrinibacteria bacterium]|nr:histidine phosphatase family protein [Candidatus Peregrinibacteria bacterium]